jgi:peptidylprolyl isomerase
MRRTLLTVTSLALVAAACSGDDSTTAGVDDTAHSPTGLTVPDVGDRCETTPDPADYLDRDIPAAIRPCEIPAELDKQVVRAGSGHSSEPGDAVIFHATLIRAEDGAVNDSSWITGRPVELSAVGRGSAATAGLELGLVGVQAGELFRLDVPSELGFGDEPPVGGQGVIQPDDALTYIIEVLAVTPQLVPADAPLDLSVATSDGAQDLTVDDLIIGDGKVVEEGDTVVVAVLLARGDNLSIFFNSWNQGSPLLIPLDESLMEGDEPITVRGIFDGLQGARVGGRRVMTMPPGLAWGDGGQPALGLPPATDLIVIADVLGAY